MPPQKTVSNGKRYVMVLVALDVASSGFDGGAVILTCTNCRSPAMIANRERPNPPITSAKAWSGCARLRCTPVIGFISHADVVLMPVERCRGSMSWQFSGRKWVKLPESNCGRLQGPLTGVEKVT